ncbi:unnamed protein product [Brachionus calyciflorus]|uniref:Uncharacterized protein n=1 Tax=Brachionus calyciflorus TaxID=104777 RepID=A0A813PK86_9BILA|nr:unnamed protein product [Brachionus calyciflorus]
MEKSKKIFNRIHLTSLNSLILTILITIIQLYLISNRIILLNNLKNNLSQITSSLPILSNQHKLNNSIIINIFILTFSLIFTLVYACLGSIRLKIYSHDGFKLGQNFDSFETKNEFLKNVSINSSNNSACSISSEETNSISISKQKLTKFEDNSKKKFNCYSFSTPVFWSELPPLGSLFHLLASLCLLLAEIQLSSRRIQLGNKPIGDIFSTKLDFLFGEPINRLKIFKSSQDLTLVSSLDLTSTSPNQENNLNDVINSRDDFTVFQNPLSNVVSNSISLDYLNFLIALIYFILKTNQTFWSSSKKFTTILLFFTLLMSLLMSLSYTGFEIVFKSNNLKVIAKNFLFSYQKRENLIDDFGHDISSTLIYLISSLIIFINIFLLTKFGFRKFNMEKFKFEKNLSKYFRKNNREIESVTEIVEKNGEYNLDKSETISNCSPKSSSSFNTSLSSSSKLCKHSFSFSYKENILSSFLLLFYCVLRSLFIYELIIIFKYTYDYLILANILIEIIFIFTWILSLLCLTFIDEWNFKLNTTYKILFWNHVYNLSNLKQSFNSGISSINSQKIIGNSTNQNNERSQIIESVKHVTETNNTTTKTPGLLVRDDSVTNRSSYLSSSSITEVSSLMPSTFANNSKYNAKLIKTSALNPNGLVSSTIMNERNIVMINDDESSNDDSSIKLQPLRIDNEFYNSLNENSQMYSQIKRNNFKMENEEDDINDYVKKRSYSCRPSSNRNSTYSNGSLKKSLPTSNATVATIGEIMEENSNQFLNKNCSVSIIQKTLNIIDSASSPSATDSGRDSITESPVSNINNQITNKQYLRGYNDLNTSILSNNNKYNGLTVQQLKKTNQPIDTNC